MKDRSIRRRIAIGFTLVELMVVLLIVSLITAAVAIPLMTRIEDKKIEQTIAALELAQAKLLAYASKFGYLPCPATATSNGMEPSPWTDHAAGNCPEWQGYLPAAALGWSPVDAQGYAIDAWGTTGSRIRYAVANDTVAGITNPFTRVNGMANAGMGAVASAGLLRVCGSGSGVNPGVDCGTAPTLSSNAAFVVWSVGPNALTGGTSIHESQNPNPNTGGTADRIFVSRDWSNGTGGDFDDIVRWTSGAKVAGHLQTAGLMSPSGSGQGGTGGGCSSSSSSNTSNNTSNNSSTNNSGPGNSNSSTNSSASNNISYGCSGSSSNSSSNSSNNS